MTLLTVSVFGTSNKENERRVPIHPEQIQWIDPKIREKLIFEKGYGEPFGMEDDELSQLAGGLSTREELFSLGDIILLPKPVKADIDQMRKGTIHWGWPHCVQQEGITQSAVDQKLTLIAWEGMHRWSKHGDWQMHIFHNNNELAGYAAVLHAFSLLGINGYYGPQRKAIVLSFGSASRGAIHALQGLGVQDISVFTSRYSILVADQIVGINYRHFEMDSQGKVLAFQEDSQTSYPIMDEISPADIVVNGILQDTDKPLMFVQGSERNQLKPGALIIDVSCDEGMGFDFAKPTTFKDPLIKIDRAHYYGVDHTPSYLWNSASWEISNSLLPYLPIVMEGSERWAKSETIKRAIEIRDGVIENPKILSFQNRNDEYPHQVLNPK